MISMCVCVRAVGAPSDIGYQTRPYFSIDFQQEYGERQDSDKCGSAPVKKKKKHYKYYNIK